MEYREATVAQTISSNYQHRMEFAEAQAKVISDKILTLACMKNHAVATTNQQ